MSDTPLPARRTFDDREVARILERAAELQASPGGGGDASTGMSLAELEQVAREAGIDPAMVRRAAAEVARGGRAVSAPAPVLGAPVRLVAERVLAGELPESRFATILEVIQRETDDPGQPSGIGGTLVWHSSPPLQYARARWSRRLAVRVTPRDGHTTVRVEESIADAAGGIFGGLMGGIGGTGLGLSLGIGIGVMHAPLVAVGLAALAVGGSYGLARGIFGAVSKRRARQLERLADVVARELERQL